MKLTFNNIDPCKLNDELIANGITPLLVESTPYKNEEDKNPIRSEVIVTLEDSVDTTQVAEIANTDIVSTTN